VNTFEDIRSELLERKEKRAGEELIQESTKKQKVEDDKETADLKQLMEIIQNKEGVAIDAITLAVKSPKIVDWKIHKDEKKSYYQIVRADGKVNTFEDIRSELLERKEKRAGEELIQESTKKQKVEDDKETADLKQLMEIIQNKEGVAIDAITLAVKSPKIVDWKIHKDEKKSYYQIVRADGKSQMYMVFSKMFESFDREDLEDLYNLVKAKFKSTRLVKDLDLLL
nr:hypothetical protein [Tanacetum cinerariifolium]